jgi:hypothetical protein
MAVRGVVQVVWPPSSLLNYVLCVSALWSALWLCCVVLDCDVHA